MISFLRYGPTLSVVAIIGGAVWYVMDLRSDKAALQSELKDLQIDHALASDALENARQAAVVHRAHLERQTAQIKARDALLREFSEMEGGDVPLDDFLRAGAGRVWP